MNELNPKLGLALLAGLTVSGVASREADAQSRDPKRPNILVVSTEDISCYLGCYGDPQAKTPNLDRFAESAIRYTNMHTPNGVSSPSRFALITGCYPSAHGANYMRASYYNYDVVTPEYMRAYPEYLRAAGYYCTNNSKTDYQISTVESHWDENGRNATWKHCPEGQPFFAIFNINTTHEGQLWSRKEPFEVQPEDIDMKNCFPYFPDVPEVRNDLARMYTNIAIMDREAQAYFDEIEEAGLADNTIIIWFSDNGGPIPRGKRSIYNTGTNVPFMVKFPDGYRAGQVEDRLVTFMDVPATILSLAGIQVPSYMDGKPFLGSQDSKPAEYVFQARDRYDNVSDHSAGVRDKRFQYIRNYMPETSNYLHNEFRLSLPMMQLMLEMRDKGTLNEEQMLYFKTPRPVEEFYDLANDPYELHNLAGDPAFRYDFERLKAAFDEWNNTTNRVWNTKTEEEWIEEFKPGGEFQVVAAPVITKTAEGYVFSCDTPGVSYVYKVQTVKEQKDAAKALAKAQKESDIAFEKRKAEMASRPLDSIPSYMRAAMNNRPIVQDNSHWDYYSEPIPVEKGKVISVKACRAGMKTSETVTIKMK
ncbi:MAG: sulfatase [Bacteroidales bacterium]|nr:sulfatase [Bacteroidales bacterium]